MGTFTVATPKFHNFVLRRVALLFSHSGIQRYACCISHDWRGCCEVTCAMAHSSPQCSSIDRWPVNYPILGIVSRLAVKRRCYILETIPHSTRDCINARISHYQLCTHVFMLHYLPSCIFKGPNFRLGASQLRLGNQSSKRGRRAQHQTL